MNSFLNYHKILVINSGSSSLKFKLFEMPSEKVFACGICERIGTENSNLLFKDGVFEKKYELSEKFESHDVALKKIVFLLFERKLATTDDISAIGHRVVHGGTYFKNSVIITSEVIDKINELSRLAPIHNPANLIGIHSCYNFFGENLPQIAVFDTAFYANLPPEVYTYAIPRCFSEKYSIRKYGFHGTSHDYVTKICASFLRKNLSDLKIISCHLGNGSSITAVKNGVAVDTTMGFTPLDGLIMGTRCGQIDPSIVTFLLQNEKISPIEFEKILNEKSGFFGVTGSVHDMRDLDIACANGDKSALLVQKMLIYQISKIIGGYIAIMGGCDAICFTGGIAVNHARLRREVCEMLDFFKIKVYNMNESVDETSFCNFNSDEPPCIAISSEDSAISVCVIPTDEELAIARECTKFL